MFVDHLQKNKERIQKFKETGDSRYIYQNEPDKACFQHEIAYRSFKSLTGRKASDKILRDKAFNIAKNPTYGPYQRGLASMVNKCFDKTTSCSVIKNENISHQRILGLAMRELAEELHKPIITKFEKRKINSPFIDNIWVADIAGIQLIRKFNEGFRFLLCVIDIDRKYAWVIPLKHKKGITIINAF